MRTEKMGKLGSTLGGYLTSNVTILASCIYPLGFSAPIIFSVCIANRSLSHAWIPFLALSSGLELLALVDAHEVLGDAEVVDGLGDAEEGRDDDHAAEGALVERRHALVHVDLPEGVSDPGV